jgi:hypothetical protein
MAWGRIIQVAIIRGVGGEEVGKELLESELVRGHDGQRVTKNKILNTCFFNYHFYNK